MTDVWELAAYVEGHPANQGQRWRLAKKLYTSFEYRLALEHLLILKNETEPRESVVRYLAATYFRLGRLEEAISTLEDGMKIWPKDVAMREQFARTLAEAGHNERALAAWREVEKLSPEHPFAAQAVARLKATVDREAAEKARATQGIQPEASAGTEAGQAARALPGEVLCPKCGQRNSENFKRCWRCSTPLGAAPDFVDDINEKEERREPVRVPSPIVSGLALAALFAFGVFCALRGLNQVNQVVTRGGPFHGVEEVLDEAVFWTRVLIGAALIVAWPFVWRFAAELANLGDRVYDETMYHVGALLALITFACLWLPWGWLSAAAIAPVALSALIAFFMLRLPPIGAAKLWLMQLGAASALALGVIALRNGPGLVLEAPKIADFARESAARTPFTTTIPKSGTLQVKWQSSGSPWLDERILHTRLTLKPVPKEGRIMLETIESGKRLAYEQLAKDTPHRDIDSVRVGADYEFNIAGRDAVEIEAAIEGLLPFTAQAKAAPPPK